MNGLNLFFNKCFPLSAGLRAAFRGARNHARSLMLIGVAGALWFSPLPARAQWSVRVDAGKSPKDMYVADDPRRQLPDVLFQPFTAAEWAASNFAPPADTARFQDLRYGMFIHFGLSTYKGKELSWGTVQSIKWPDHRADGTCAPVGPIHDDYIQWASQLRFEQFDAKEWVRIAQAAGFHYIVAVAKHHEGFHLWDTAYSDFKLTKTPFGRDYLKELSDACHQAGMPFGIYYAQREWHNPDYDPGHPLGASHQRYLAYNRNAIRELLTNYGRVDFFWFDAAWWGGMFTADMWDAENLTRMMRQLQPHMLINNRASLPGDFDTPEQRAGYYQERAWEACLSLTETWSWSGSPPKSRDQLIRILANTACANGNALVSWGPEWNGAFDPVERQRLEEVGGWLKLNGVGIYDTRGGPWLPASWGGSTRRGNTVYLHVLDPQLTTLELPPIPSRVRSATLLNGGGTVDFTQNSAGLKFNLPATARDAADTIVVLQLDRPVTGVVRSGPSAQAFDDPVAYGKILSQQTDMAVTGGTMTVDLSAPHKVTGVVVEQGAGGPPLSLAISVDNEHWTPVAASNPSPTHWAVTVDSEAVGALLPGRAARYVRLQFPAGTPAIILHNVTIHGF